MYRGRTATAFILSALFLCSVSAALAQTAASKPAGGDEADKQCPKSGGSVVYLENLPHNQTVTVGKAKYFNAWGKPCQDTQQKVVAASGICVLKLGDPVCQATKCGGGDCKLPGTGTNSPSSPVIPPDQVDQEINKQVNPDTTLPSGEDVTQQIKNSNIDNAFTNGTTPLENVPSQTSGTDFNKALSDLYGITPGNTLGDAGFSGFKPGESVISNIFDPGSGVVDTSGFASQFDSGAYSYQQPSFGDLSQYGVQSTPDGHGGFTYDAGLPANSGFEYQPQSFGDLSQYGVPSTPDGHGGYTYETGGSAGNPWEVSTYQVPASAGAGSGLIPGSVTAPLPSELQLGPVATPPAPAPATAATNWTGANSAVPFSNYINTGGYSIAENGLVTNPNQEIAAFGNAQPSSGIETPTDIATTQRQLSFGIGQTSAENVPVALTGGWVNGNSETASNFGPMSYGDVSWINGNKTDIGSEYSISNQEGGFISFNPTPSQLSEQELARQAELANQPAAPEKTLAMQPESVSTADQTPSPCSWSGFSASGCWDKVTNYVSGSAVTPANAGESDLQKTQQTFDVTAYYPCTSASACPVQGGLASAKPGLDGESVVRTLDDYRLGKSEYVTGASDPTRYGQTFEIPEVTYKSALDGKTYTLDNVPVYVHDTGGAFDGRPDKLDIAAGVANSEGQAQQFAKEQPFLSDRYQEFANISGTDLSARGDGGGVPLPPERPQLPQDMYGENAPGGGNSNLSVAEANLALTSPMPTAEWKPSLLSGADIAGSGGGLSGGIAGPNDSAQVFAPAAAVPQPDYNTAIPTAEWIAGAQPSGEDITAQIQAQNEREAFASGNFDAPSNDVLTQNAAQAGLDAQLSAGQRDATDYNSYYDAAGVPKMSEAEIAARIPTPDTQQQSGEAITAQIQAQNEQEALNKITEGQSNDALRPDVANAPNESKSWLQSGWDSVKNWWGGPATTAPTPENTPTSPDSNLAIEAPAGQDALRPDVANAQNPMTDAEINAAIRAPATEQQSGEDITAQIQAQNEKDTKSIQDTLNSITEGQSNDQLRPTTVAEEISAQQKDKIDAQISQIEAQKEKVLATAHWTGLSSDCWTACHVVEENGVTMSKSDYEKTANATIDSLKAQSAQWEQRADFFKSSDPLAAPVAQTLLEGGDRAALAQGHLDAMLAARQQIVPGGADTTAGDQTFAQADQQLTAQGSADFHAQQLERITSGGDFTKDEQDTLRRSSSAPDYIKLSSSELATELRTQRYQGTLSGSIYNAVTSVSDPTTAQLQSRLFMTPDEVRQQQTGDVLNATKDVGIQAAVLAASTPPAGRAIGGVLEAAVPRSVMSFTDTALSKTGSALMSPLDPVSRDAFQTWWNGAGMIKQAAPVEETTVAATELETTQGAGAFNQGRQSSGYAQDSGQPGASGGYARDTVVGGTEPRLNSVLTDTPSFDGAAPGAAEGNAARAASRDTIPDGYNPETGTAKVTITAERPVEINPGTPAPQAPTALSEEEVNQALRDLPLPETTEDVAASIERMNQEYAPRVSEPAPVRESPAPIEAAPKAEPTVVREPEAPSPASEPSPQVQPIQKPIDEKLADLRDAIRYTEEQNARYAAEIPKTEVPSGPSVTDLMNQIDSRIAAGETVPPVSEPLKPMTYPEIASSYVNNLRQGFSSAYDRVTGVFSRAPETAPAVESTGRVVASEGNAAPITASPSPAATQPSIGQELNVIANKAPVTAPETAPSPSIGAQDRPVPTAADNRSLTQKIRDAFTGTDSRAPAVADAGSDAGVNAAVRAQQENTFGRQLTDAEAKQAGLTTESKGLDSITSQTLKEPAPSAGPKDVTTVDIAENSQVTIRPSLDAAPKDGVVVAINDSHNAVIVAGTDAERAALANAGDITGREVYVVVSKADAAKLAEAGAGGSADITVYPVPRGGLGSAVDVGEAVPLETAAQQGGAFSRAIDGVQQKVSDMWQGVKEKWFGGSKPEVAEALPGAPKTSDIAIKTDTPSATAIDEAGTTAAEPSIPDAPSNATPVIDRATGKSLKIASLQEYPVSEASPISKVYSVSVRDLPENAAFTKQPGDTLTLYRGLGQKYDPAFVGPDPYFTPNMNEAIGYALGEGTDPQLMVIEINSSAYADLTAYRTLENAAGTRPLGQGEALGKGYIQVPNDWLSANVENPTLASTIRGTNSAVSEALADSNAKINAALQDRFAAQRSFELKAQDSVPNWKDLNTAERHAMLTADPAYSSAAAKVDEAYRAQTSVTKDLAGRIVVQTDATPAVEQGVLSRAIDGVQQKVSDLWQGAKEKWFGGSKPEIAETLPGAPKATPDVAPAEAAAKPVESAAPSATLDETAAPKPVEAQPRPADVAAGPKAENENPIPTETKPSTGVPAGEVNPVPSAAKADATAGTAAEKGAAADSGAAAATKSGSTLPGTIANGAWTAARTACLGGLVRFGVCVGLGWAYLDHVGVAPRGAIGIGGSGPLGSTAPAPANSNGPVYPADDIFGGDVSKNVKPADIKAPAAPAKTPVAPVRPPGYTPAPPAFGQTHFCMVSTAPIVYRTSPAGVPCGAGAALPQSMLGQALGQALGSSLGGSGSSGSGTASAPLLQTPTTTVPTPTPAKSVVTLIANPPSVHVGSTTSISWAAAGPAQCALTDPTGALVATGTPNPKAAFTIALSTTTTFKIDCVGGAGNAGASLTIPVK